MDTTTNSKILEWVSALMAGLLGAVEPPPVVLPEPAPAITPEIVCRIVRQNEGEVELFTATATSAERIEEGSFMLVVRSDGVNRSISRQQGSFDAHPGETVQLATVRLRGAERAKTTVYLDLSVANSHVPCTTE